MAKNRTRRSKKSKGGNALPSVTTMEEVPTAPVQPTATAEGGKRRKASKTRKASKGASDWNKKVMMVYHEMKKKNPAVKLGEAMKECSRRKKRGEL